MTGRRIWLCADDYGIAPGVDAAIRDLVERGRLNATSVMVVAPGCTPAAADALARLADAGKCAIGLHLTLTPPFAPRSASYADADSFRPIGPTLVRASARRLSPPRLAAEVDAQLDAFAMLFGRMPDFVDGHQHVHLFPQVRDAVLDAVVARAPRAWLRQCGSAAPRLSRIGDGKGHLLDLLSRQFRKRADARGLATNSAFAGTYMFARDADIARLFPQFLDGLPDGGLVMCHPGKVDAALAAVDTLTDLREREYAYFAGDAFPALLAERNVTLR